MTANNNLFIAFEGIDGSGKSTQVKLLAERLKQDGHKVYTTFEPTDSPIGSLIRNIMKGRIEADSRTIAGLFVADRLDHLLNKTDGILKKLEEGYTVLTDRYLLSSYAYQGAHVSMDWVIQANSQSAKLLKPDLHVYIDIHPEKSMQRIAKGRDLTELYESAGVLEKVRNKYLEAIDKFKSGESIYVADGDRPPESVAEEIWNAVHNLAIKEG